MSSKCDIRFDRLALGGADVGAVAKNQGFMALPRIRVYPASGTLPRLTLSPSPGRSDQNDSDDSIVSPPRVRKA